MEKKEWSFGTMQAKVKAENGQLTWSLFGNGGSSYPLRSVTGVQYEKGGFMAVMGAFVILVAGGDNRRVQVPSKDASAQIVADINNYIAAYHQAQQTPVPKPTSSIADELTKLANLRDAGVLTEQEFQTQKARVLG
ncbi:SHOCT domain-containing protein [Microvirga sp. STS02]|uniref:SHOCT domain-containing protein n=1 Tax=Hymenobacter negativus TaxID=2795026 RepID=UPI0018DC1461|nr:MULTISPECIES: SHOCT domain-containing protein [Bacteria]MBH8569352.1 SHOCT domain-containing protein [Hymenobacter negativus]MBR7209086.1 SHOCT domain-containing protein [Microvirga sp. STS02]